MRGSLFGTSRPGQRARTRPRNPLLERLEERQLLATFIVQNTGDLDTQGNVVPDSLRDAITKANQNGGEDTIEFNITGSGIQTIAPTRALPAITGSVVIDATTQPGYGGTPLIEINGANAGTTTNGLRISSSDVTIKGLAINSFGASGIRIEANQITVQSCYVGTSPTGTVARPNGASGIFIDNGSSCLIGGGAGSGNVLSGNTGPGLTINGSASSNTVVGNVIGAAAGGGGPLANSVGILISGANSNQIGGELSGEGNVISGNTGDGVQIVGINSRNNRLINNFIGTNRAGTLAVPNGAAGVQVTNAAFTSIGGLTSTSGNVISGNTGPGISLTGAANTTIQGNKIGTNQGGAADLGNGHAGVLISGANSAGSIVGGTVTGAGNVIAFNGKNPPAGTPSGGVLVTGGVDIPILSNSIDANNGLGIDIDADGPDAGSVPNLTQAATASGRTLVQGFIVGRVATTYIVQFFTQPTQDPSGFGEGRTFIGSASVMTNINGIGTINSLLTSPSVVGDFLTATATVVPVATGATTEFSQSIQITPAQIADLTIDIADSPDPATRGGTLTYTATVTNRGPDTATNVQFTQQIPTSMTISGITSSQGTVSSGSGNVLTGTLGSIPSGQSVTVTVTVTPTLNGTFTTTASAISAEIDTDESNNSDSEDTSVNVPADVSVTFSPDEIEVVQNQTLSFRALVTNNVTSQAAGNATNVVVRATIPSTVTFVGAFTGQGTASLVGDTVVFNLGTLSLGATIALRIDVIPLFTGPFDQQINVTSTELDPDTDNNTDSATAVVLPEADLSVTIAAAPESALFDETLSYTVTARNNGPTTSANLGEAQPSDNVIVTFVIPASEGAIVYSDLVASPGGTPVVDGNKITVNFGTINPGEAATLTFSIPAKHRPGYNASATVSSEDSGDLNPANDTDAIFTAVDPADLQLVSVTTDPATAEAGEPLTYTVRFRNAGPGTASNLVFLGTLGTGLEFVSATSTATQVPSFSSSTNAVTLAIPSLASGAEVTVTIVATPQQQGVVLLTNVVISDNADLDSSDNYSVTQTPVSPADVAVTLTPSANSVLAGNAITYTAVVTNNGPLAAPAVGLLDVLPGGVTFVSATTTKGVIGNYGGTVAAQLGTLAPGESVTITVTLIPLVEGLLAHSVVVGTDAFDNATDNNSASVGVQVTNSPGVVAFSAPSVTAPENGGVARLTLTRTSGTKGTVSVRYTIVPGSAVPGVNYAAVSDFAVFEDGQTTATIEVPLIVDGVSTGPLTATVVLSEPQGGATIGGQATSGLTIANTDVDLVPPYVADLNLIGSPSGISGVVLSFSEPVDAARATNPGNYSLFTANGSPVAFSPPVYDPGARTVTLFPLGTLPAGPGFYTVIVNGSASTGVTDPSGNPIPNGGYVGSFARGSSLNYVDSDGDRVGLNLKGGGYLDAVRGANGDALILRVVGPGPGSRNRPTLTGTVKRSGLLGNGVTTIGQIRGVNAGGVLSRLTSPPFYVNGQLQGPISVLSVGTAFPKNIAAGRLSSLRKARV